MIMSKASKTIGLFILAIVVLHFQTNGQKQPKDYKELKNTVRVNILNPIIDTKYIVVGYERVLKNNQTFSVNIGRFSLPKFGSTTSDFAQIEKSYKDKGINASADYRFYLKNLNSYSAPRGVYLAPFYSFNYFSRENKWTLNSNPAQGEVITDLSFNINTIGGEIGYQFVAWNRLAIDFVMFGPGVGFYGFKASLKTTLSPDDEALFFKELNDKLKEKFPGYDLVIKSTEFETKGSSRLTSLGFRYMIHLGFRF